MGTNEVVYETQRCAETCILARLRMLRMLNSNVTVSVYVAYHLS